MRDNGSFDHVDELAAELALGIAVGDERARALRHLAECAACRLRVQELAEVADELLRLVPSEEPSSGFEAGVVKRIAAERRGTRPKRRWLPGWRHVLVVAPAAAALSAVVSAVAVYERTETDRELGALYRQTLEVANGEAFGALPLHGPDRRRAGFVFGYEGRPSWLFVIVLRPNVSGTFAVEVVTRRGRQLSLGSMAVANGRGTLGAILPASLFEVARVRVAEKGGTRTFTAVAPPLPD